MRGASCDSNSPISWLGSVRHIGNGYAFIHAFERLPDTHPRNIEGIAIIKLFSYINLPFPLLIPRNSMLFLEEKTFRKIENSGLKIDDFFGNFAEVINQKILDNSEIKSLLKQKEQNLIDSFSEIKAKAELTDKSFVNLVKAEETRQLKSFKRMQKRLLKAEKIKQSEKFDQMQNLFLKVHPGGTWQERVFNFSVFYADFGKQWIADSYQLMDVQKSELIISSI